VIPDQWELSDHPGGEAHLSWSSQGSRPCHPGRDRARAGRFPAGAVRVPAVLVLANAGAAFPAQAAGRTPPAMMLRAE
jgi:hypothetical protein